MAKQKISSLNLAWDIVGFGLIFMGAALLRYSKDEVTGISAGLITAIGFAILGVSKYIIK